MDAPGSIRISCSKCGARYAVKEEDLFRLEGSTCRRCRGLLEIPLSQAVAAPVAEDQIVTWLQSGEQD